MAIKSLLVNNILCDEDLFNNKAAIINAIDTIIIGEAAIANRDDHGNMTPNFGEENISAAKYVMEIAVMDKKMAMKKIVLYIFISGTCIRFLDYTCHFLDERLSQAARKDCCI